MGLSWKKEDGEVISLEQIQNNQKLLLFIISLLLILTLVVFACIGYLDTSNYITYIVNTIKEVCG